MKPGEGPAWAVIQEAAKYPLTARIAANLYRNGIKAGTFNQMWQKSGYGSTPYPLIVEVENYLRDFVTNPPDDRLLELAQRM
jgi:hypothetical protein